MIRKTAKGFCIEVETAGNPEDDYLNMLNGMIDLLQQPAAQGENYYVLELFRAMLPDHDCARVMFAQMEE